MKIINKNNFNKTTLLILLVLLQTASNGQTAYFENKIFKYEGSTLKNKNSDSSFNKGKLYLGLSYGIGFNSLYKYHDLTVNNKKVSMSLGTGYGFLVNFETSYFFSNHTGCMFGTSYKKSNLEVKKMKEIYIDTSIYMNRDFSYVDESIEYQSLVIPFHLINLFNFRSKYSALLFEYGNSFELPFLVSYNINYKDISTFDNINKNGRINRNKLKPTINLDLSVGFLYKQKNINFYISYYQSAHLSSIVSDKSEIESLKVISFAIRLGILYNI